MLATCECGTQVSVAGGNSYDLNSDVTAGTHVCPTDEIKLEIRTQGGYHRFVATFANQEQAIEYFERQASVASFSEVEGAPISGNHTRLLAVLYPTCEHGLSESLCYGPAHYASDEEIARGY